ncbi:MAG: undecaprenyldiphospho-muramoylpentapeptide beta-N-acetylglucosaminyltransferase [Bacteroidales bacterium]
MQQSHRFILSGGGTGGHIFPAIAIADAIRQREANAKILFVGALGRMEMEKVPAAGYEIEGLWISGLQRKLTIRNLSFPFKVLSSILKARKIVISFDPHVVIGTGGYASGPTLKAAASLGYPTLIQEQNSYPGITNKLLAKKAERICVAYEGLQRWFPAEKIVITGNPVRRDLLNLSSKREEAFKFFGLDPAKKTLLVIGGSLGALTLNESMDTSIRNILDQDIQVIWQTGKNYHASAQSRHGDQFQGTTRIYAFINRMDLAYAAADLIVSRAGAIAISELCIAGKPCILVPSPNVAEDHQTKNALALTEKNAAILVQDINARNELGNCILNTLSDTGKMKLLGEAIGHMAFTEATDRITDNVFELIRE